MSHRIIYNVNVLYYVIIYLRDMQYFLYKQYILSYFILINLIIVDLISLTIHYFNYIIIIDVVANVYSNGWKYRIIWLLFLSKSYNDNILNHKYKSASISLNQTPQLSVIP